MLWKWIAIGTMTLGMLAGQSSAKACGEKSAQAASAEERPWMAVAAPEAPRGRGGSAVRVSQLGSPSLQRSLGQDSGSRTSGGVRYRLLDSRGGRAPASLGASSWELMRLTGIDPGSAQREAYLRSSPVRLGVNPTSYRLKSFQQEVPWME